jgi:hypothetical protein
MGTTPLFSRSRYQKSDPDRTFGRGRDDVRQPQKRPRDDPREPRGRVARGAGQDSSAKDRQGFGAAERDRFAPLDLIVGKREPGEAFGETV